MSHGVRRVRSVTAARFVVLQPTLSHVMQHDLIHRYSYRYERNEHKSSSTFWQQRLEQIVCLEIPAHCFSPKSETFT